MPNKTPSKPATPVKTSVKATVDNQNSLRVDELARVSGGVSINKKVDKPSPVFF